MGKGESLLSKFGMEELVEKVKRGEITLEAVNLASSLSVREAYRRIEGEIHTVNTALGLAAKAHSMQAPPRDPSVDSALHAAGITPMKDGTPTSLDSDTSRSVVNGLIMQLMSEGMSLPEIENEFSTFGKSPFDGEPISPATIAIMEQKMKEKIAEIRDINYHAAIETAKEEEAEAPGASMSPTPGMSSTKNRSLSHGPTPSR